MLLGKPFGEPSRYAIKVLDFISQHKLPYSPYVPILYTQDIKITPEMYPPKPPDRSQLYRHLNPPEENPWLGGVSIGKIIVQKETELHRLIIKQFKHKISSEIYNPPFHKTYHWKDFGGETQAMSALDADHKNFCDKYNAWRNRYRVRYCEFTDMFFLQVKVNHFFPYACFECDIEDAQNIFSKNWYLHAVTYLDEYEEEMVRHHIVQKTFEGKSIKKGTSLTRFLFPSGQYIPFDNNVLNCRRSNLVAPTKIRY
jgi:hypothetical protein